ncbi:2,3,4,5-tetrahydropyridine-2,6-dicarboxylate N-acetyltransferase [Emticicia aquatica]|uniref:2,3,4,5-tetrahydropyridine-2,6-dicarboxylate N-acetyltransferase n=1 Tax=Emticicia aquatica TaxID=1681835 RepID=A0ABN8EWJ5_9BACT|nr:WcaF family extracellular polysaccharide biosynthesis acetyltransferase [Emticicia aquatica]CAH0995302.1 2,3,4,5-tetrahydropyridine-2,6-dicarboxylate N-acetyltransferase [Emticicia aquatica]
MNKTDLSKYNNDWYKKSNLTKGFLVTLIWFIVNKIFLNSYLLIPVSFKRAILRFFGAKIGKNVMIKHSVNIKYPWNLDIGDNVWIGENVWIDNLGKVKIGDNSCLSQGALLLSGNHNYKSSTFDLIVEDIIIEDGVWIGAKSVVCSGITCHSHSVLSVNSVATKSLDAYYIYQGNPANAIRQREIAF